MLILDRTATDSWGIDLLNILMGKLGVSDSDLQPVVILEL